MLKGRRAVRQVPFPGMEEDANAVIGVRILSDSEIDDCRVHASGYMERRAKAMPGQMEGAQLASIDPEFLQREIKRQMIALAFVSATERDGSGKPLPFFPSPDAVESLDPLMVESFFQVYLQHNDYVNPYAFLDEAKITELVDALGKEGADAAWLSLCDADTLGRCVLTLAKRLRDSRTAK